MTASGRLQTKISLQSMLIQFPLSGEEQTVFN
jgi:hypothetical protein